MSIFKARVKEFDDALAQDVVDLKELRRLTFNGVPDVQSFRALSWKLLLGYLGPRRSSWTTTLAQKRALYQQFIEELVLPPGHSCNGAGEGDGDGDVAVDSRGVGLQDHPLSEGPESAWNTFFNENKFLLQIGKDVRRLCPDISFFQQPTEYPCDIVVHSKGEHGRRLHKRGKNEIVGPIYYVMASDPDLSYRAHAEADCFFCFTALMSEIRDFFIKTLDDAEGGIKIQREAILENDFASNVKLLQNYPPIDINVVITHAVSLA
ncbi:GL13210 [Drosophila persimilis]|uniref:GL13210 n=1 Tax=Drosophila persimilis TaxID=7234 RepID=B4IQW5_DROPE|nr:GL13210 [Drosophila persimilis]